MGIVRAQLGHRHRELLGAHPAAPGFLQPRVSLIYTGGSGNSELGMSFRLPVHHIYRAGVVISG